MTTTVSSQIKSGAYRKLDELKRDVASAISAVAPDQTNPLIATPLARFRREFDRLIAHDGRQTPPGSRKRSVNGDIKVEEEDGDAEAFTAASDHHEVLAVFGALANQRPKLVYSSLQKQDATRPPRPLDTARLHHNISVEALAPTTRPAAIDKASRATTLGAAFPRRPGAKALEPPRPPPTVVTRAHIPHWYRPDAPPRPTPLRVGGRESSYHQPQSTGQWLAYTAPAAGKPITAERRKPTERSGSAGAAEREPADGSDAGRMRRELRARGADERMLKRVHESFGLTHDNASAVIPQQQRSGVWWAKVGQHKYGHADLPEETLEDDGAIEADGDEETEAFRKAVEGFDDELNGDAADENPLVNGALDGDTSSDANDVDGMLGEAADLLTTLHSYHQNRHLSISSASANAADVKLLGDATTPSADEAAVHARLRRRLAALIQLLPPHAVARLRGDPQANLTVRRTLQVAGPAYRGTLPDVDVAAAARPVPAPTAPLASIANAARSQQHQASPRPAGYPHGSGSATATQRPQITYNHGRTPSQQFNPFAPRPGLSAHQAAAQGPSTPRAYGSPFATATPSGAGGALPNGTRPYSGGGYASYGHGYGSGGAAGTPTGAGAPRAYGRPPPQQPHYANQRPPHGAPYGANQAAHGYNQAYAAARSPNPASAAADLARSLSPPQNPPGSAGSGTVARPPSASANPVASPYAGPPHRASPVARPASGGPAVRPGSGAGGAGGNGGFNTVGDALNMSPAEQAQLAQRSARLARPPFPPPPPQQGQPPFPQTQQQTQSQQQPSQSQQQAAGGGGGGGSGGGSAQALLLQQRQAALAHSQAHALARQAERAAATSAAGGGAMTPPPPQQQGLARGSPGAAKVEASPS